MGSKLKVQGFGFGGSRLRDFVSEVCSPAVRGTEALVILMAKDTQAGRPKRSCAWCGKP